MRNFIAIVVLAGVCMLSAVAQQTDPVAVLKSDAPLEQKSEALRLLAQKGDPGTIPLLAPMLADEQLSHMARYALEPMPYPEAGQALRDALGKTSGRLQIGVINSLAIRKDAEAVPALAALLTAAPDVAQAAAVALGTVATPEAAAALENALGQANLAPVTLQAVCDGLLGCAESYVAKGQLFRAIAIYDRLLQLPAAPQHVHTGALRGAVLSRGAEEGLPLLAERLRGEDADGFSDALRVARELHADKNVAGALVEILPALNDERKIRVLDVFVAENADVAGPAVLAEADKGAPAVREAALHTLARMGYAPALELLERVAVAEEGAPAKAAREALSYFPGKEGDAVVTRLLQNEQAQTRRMAVGLVGEGALDEPVPVLMAAAKSDADEGVRVAALEALRGYAGLAEMPTLLSDHLLNARSQAERQAAEVTLAALSERQKRVSGGPAAGSAPDAVTDAFVAALGQAQGEAKPAVVRLLGSTGSPKAFEAVQAAAASDDPAVKDTALRTLCEWPTTQALPTVLEMAKGSAGDAMKAPALRGAVRLLGQSDAPAGELLGHYTTLMDLAKASADDKKVVLSGLARVAHPGALELALAQFGDPAVKAEAVLAAGSIADDLGESAREDASVFNGADLTGWQGDTNLWRFEDGAIVGQSTQPLTKNEFIWSNVPVRDFHLVVDMMLEPNTANAGIQFRSEKIDERGQARGYQADAGQDVWGRLYHEQGRGKLFWDGRAEKAVKPGEWNRVEILAVGPAIWTAINGELGVALLEPEGERSGLVAFQLHAGPPTTARYRVIKLVHDPKVELAGRDAEALVAELKGPDAK